MNNKKLLVFVLIAIAAGGAYYAIAVRRAPPPIPIEIGVIGTGPEGIIYQLAKDRGIDRAHGLDLLLQKSDSPPDISRQLEQREIPAGMFAPITAAQLAISGKHIRIFVPFFKVNIAALVRSDSPYRTLEDLKGKRIAIFSKRTNTFSDVAIILRAVGIDLESDFQLTFSNSIPEMRDAVLDGEVDGMFQVVNVGPVIHSLVEGEIRIISRLNDIWKSKTGFDMPFSGLAAYEDWITANRSTAKRLADVYYEASRYLLDHPDAIRQYRDLVGLQTEEDIEFLKGEHARVLYREFDQQLEDALLRLLKGAFETGILPALPEQSVILRQ